MYYMQWTCILYLQFIQNFGDFEQIIIWSFLNLLILECCKNLDFNRIIILSLKLFRHISCFFLFLFYTITEISVDIKVTKKLKNCQDDILSFLSMPRSSVLNIRRFEIELISSIFLPGHVIKTWLLIIMLRVLYLKSSLESESRIAWIT